MFNIRIIAENIFQKNSSASSTKCDFSALHYLLTGLQFEELSNGSRLDKVLIIITIFIILSVAG